MPPPETYESEIGSQSTMCQVQAGAYVSLLTPGENKYSDCHPRKTTTYMFHVVSITAHTYDRRKSIGEKETKKRKKIKERKEKRQKTKQNEKGKQREEKDKKSKERQDKNARKKKKRRRRKKKTKKKRNKNVILADPRNCLRMAVSPSDD